MERGCTSNFFISCVRISAHRPLYHYHYKDHIYLHQKKYPYMWTLTNIRIENIHLRYYQTWVFIWHKRRKRSQIILKNSTTGQKSVNNMYYLTHATILISYYYRIPPFKKNAVSSKYFVDQITNFTPQIF